MPSPTEAEPNAIVPQSLAPQALADAGLNHQVHRPLLQHTSAHPILDVLAAAAFQHHALDARQMQQMREHQPSRPGPDNSNLSSHSCFSNLPTVHPPRRIEVMDSNRGAWPELPLAAWQDTYDTLHMWTQIVGKIRMTLTPLINHYWNVTLYVSARGLTTSAIPYPGGIFQMEFDFIDHKLMIETSRG